MQESINLATHFVVYSYTFLIKMRKMKKKAQYLGKLLHVPQSQVLFYGRRLKSYLRTA